MAHNNNHSGTGLIGDVIQRKADVSVGGFYHWSSTYPFMKFSDSIQKVRVMHLVPVVKPLPSFLIPFMPFPLIVRACILGTFFVAIVMLFATRKFGLKYLKLRPVRGSSFKDAVLLILRISIFEGINKVR